jgi:hypothetical protein
MCLFALFFRGQLTSKLWAPKVFFAVFLALLAVSVTLGVVGVYSAPIGQEEMSVLIDDTFHLGAGEVRRQGIGNFHGNGTVGDGSIHENLILRVENLDVFVRNFSVISYGATHYNSTDQAIVCNLTTGADYYEAVFWTAGANSGWVRFQVWVSQPGVVYPFAVLVGPAKLLFLMGVAGVVLLLLRNGVVKAKSVEKPVLPQLRSADRRVLVALLLVSLVFWLAVIAFSSNPLGTFENWYTDHARDTYVANLFLKDGLAVFSAPLDVLASQDNSSFMFVTWPEMPNLYPIGSIAVFLPFGALVSAGVDVVLVYKLEIGVFLVFAHVCLYVFLGRFWVQNDFPVLAWKNAKSNVAVFRGADLKAKVPLLREYFVLALKLVGVYVIYASLVPFAANGMFDAVAILFLLLAVVAFLASRMDMFLLLVGVSVLFKYQAAIFLFPLIVVAAVKLLENNNLRSLVRNWAVVSAVACAAVAGFTAVLSAPYLMETRDVLVMNAVNAFSPHAQIPWSWQASAVLGVLAVTLLYSVYMFNRNRLLSVSAVFLLLPTFCLPYFQNWYLPFLFAYVLIPQRKEDFGVTMLWMVFVVFMLSFGGSGLNPGVLVQHFEAMVSSGLVGLGL